MYFFRGRLLENHQNLVFFVAFFWALILGAGLQLLILPLIPSLHAGNGLLVGGDWVDFHLQAKKLVVLMNQKGWIAWELRPNGNAPVGITAATYYISGITKPWVVLPINALLFGLGATFLHKIFTLIATKRIAFFAVLPYVCFPSAIMIYGQIHKDVFSITGILSVIYVMALFSLDEKLVFKRLFLRLCVLSFGCLLVWIVRPYLLQSILLSSLAVIIFLLLFSLSQRTKVWFFGILCVLLVELSIYKLPAPVLIEDSALQTQTQTQTQTVIFKLNVARLRFIEDYPNAGSNLDLNVRFFTFTDVIEYSPRALAIGLFSPFPSMWLSPGVSNGGNFMRLVSAVEMTLSYIMLIGVFPLILYSKEKKLPIFVVTIFSLVMLLILALVVANVGSLYRMRYAYFQIFNGLGLLGWWFFRSRYSVNKKTL